MLIPSAVHTFHVTARTLEDETRNGESNTHRNPEWWGD